MVPIDRVLQAGGPDPKPWQGLSGGTEVWREIGEFFSELKAVAQDSEVRMPDLDITVENAEAVPFAVSPTWLFKLRVANADPARSHPHGGLASPDPD